MSSVDFGKVAEDYSLYRPGLPDTFFDRAVERGLSFRNKRVLDLGTGTGSMARRIAQLGSRVIGVDISLELITEARELDRLAGVNVEYLVSRAEATQIPNASVDMVTAAQCWHWFDREIAAEEAFRVLTPGGQILIVHFDWLPLPGNVVSATEMLIQKFNPSWEMGGGTGLYPGWLTDLAVAGFQRLETFSFDVTVMFNHSSWRGRIRASAGVGASLPLDKIVLFDEQLGQLLQINFPGEPLEVPHRVFSVIGEKPRVTQSL